MSSLSLVQNGTSIDLDTLRASARDLAEQSRSISTRKAYEADVKAFCAWCRDRGLSCLPASPETVSVYIAALREGQYSPATIARRLASISTYHQVAGYESPTRHPVVRAVLSGLRRSASSQRRVNALSVEDVRRMVLATDKGLLGIRDRALLLVGFASAMRRSEVCSLGIDDVAFVTEGLLLSLRRSKTNQEGEPETIAVPYGSDPKTCPVRSLRTWIDAAGITDGHLFRSVNRHGQVSQGHLTDRVVAMVVKRLGEKIGLDPANLAGHSLRAGFATSAARAGAPSHSIRRQTRHKSDAMLSRYIRQGTQWDDHAGMRLGL